MTTPAPTADASLKSLQPSTGLFMPPFYSHRNMATMTVPSGAGTVRLTPEAGDPRAAIIVNGQIVASGQASEPLGLAPGRNVVRVDVTAQDGKSTRLYQVKVFRPYPLPTWARVRETSPWAPRDSAGELVFHDRMWLFGGYLPRLVADVWSSPNGVDWDEVGAIPTEAGINIPVCFVHGDRMWVADNKGRLFSSSDGAQWSLATEKAPWSGRYAAGGAAFDGRMWVVGGQKDNRLFNDVWSSTDGAQWTLEAAEAPWSRRQTFGNLAVHDGKLWLIGGGVTGATFKAYRDVWNSPDGRNWTQVTDQAPWPVRIWSSCVVYQNHLWLIGGFRPQPTQNNFNDVWYSADGAAWSQLVTEDIWSPRHEVSAYVFRGRLWVMAGNSWPLMNDVWSLEIPGLSFLSQPVCEELVTAGYSYHARAGFNRSGRPIRYRLAERPDWLAIHPDAGMIRGTPPVVGDFPVAVEAFDDAGETARQAYTLHVIPMGGA